MALHFFQERKHCRFVNKGRESIPGSAENTPVQEGFEEKPVYQNCPVSFDSTEVSGPV
jgi:hypothetical protein